MNALATSGSEFGRLHEQLVPHVPQGSRVPEEALRNAILGSLLTLAAALTSAVLPDPASVREGGFFIVAAGFSSAWVAGVKALAGPLAVLALAGLAIDAYLWMVGRREDGWRYACLAQPWLGLCALGAVLAFVVLFLVNLALWIVFIGVVIAAGIAALALLGAIASE